MAKYNINHSLLDKAAEKLNSAVALRPVKIENKIEGYGLTLKRERRKVKILLLLVLIETAFIIYKAT